MSNIAQFVVPDAATTPVNHTFMPIKAEAGVAMWKEQSNASAVGFWPFTLRFREPLRGQTERIYRVTEDLSMPIVVTETVNGVSRPVVARTLRAKIEYILPEDSTEQERKDLRKLIEGCNSSVLVKEAIEKLIPTF